MKEYIAEYIIPVFKNGRNYELDFLNATQVIRCKDCKWYRAPFRDESMGVCGLYTDFTTFSKNDDDFCSEAMPKENG
jgi:hypothetical protein